MQIGEDPEGSEIRGYLVFISHSHEDKDLAIKIQKYLRFYALPAFVAHEDIEPNEEWTKAIINTAAECKVFIYHNHPEILIPYAKMKTKNKVIVDNI